MRSLAVLAAGFTAALQTVALAAPRKPDAAVPFDVEAVVRRVHFAFRQEGPRFTGGHATYGVELNAGRLSIRPVKPGRHPRPEPGRMLERGTAPGIGAALVVETRSIARGGHEIRPQASPVVDERGRLIRRAALVHEMVENRDDGVELSWRFLKRPAGRDELNVRVAVAGLAHRGETARGHHFQDDASRLGVRFGHATWIGADGRRIDVAARWNGREIVIAVPARVVDESSYPAVLDPILAPEVPLTDPVPGPASGPQASISAAYEPSGSSFVAWTDRRAAAASQIFGTRVGPDGTVLDPAGILLSTRDADPVSSPSVVFDGTNFLVVFSAGNDIWGRRVSLGGAFVDAVPFPICNQASAQRTPLASSNGTTTLVVWDDYRNFGTAGIDIYGARVTGATVSDGVGSGIQISGAPADQSAPRVTWGNGHWFVVWDDRRSGTSIDVYGARVSGANGSVLSGIAISAATGDQHQPWPASNGTDYFVVWRDSRNVNPAFSDIYGTRVASSNGAVLDPAGIPICTNGQYQSLPSVAFASGASHYQVVWEDSRDSGLFGSRVDAATGVPLDAADGAAIVGSVPIDRRVWAPRIFTAGAAFYVGWQRNPEDGDQNVVGSRLTAAPYLVDAPGLDLTFSANLQAEVAIAADADNYFAVWTEDRGGSRSVWGARINGTTGESLDPDGILISEGGYGEETPAVAFNGTEYLVVWRASFDTIRMARVTTAGVVLDPEGRVLVTGEFLFPGMPHLASDGSHWFVAWLQAGAPLGALFGSRIDAAGNVLDPGGFAIASAPQRPGAPRVAFSGGYYLVAWSDDDGGLDGTDLYAARVSASGVVQDPAGIPIAVGPGWIEFAGYDVTHSGATFVVAYQEDFTVHRARIASATGALLDTAALAPSGSFYPTAINGGDAVLVLYSTSGFPSGFDREVKGTRVSLAGADLDAVDWDVAADGVPWNGYAVAARPGSPGRALVAYSRYDASPGITSDRVHARLVTTDEIFADGFDSGDVGAWSSAQTDGGDLTVSANAALAGTAAGMQVTVDDAAGVFVVDDSPGNEDRYRARFYFDPNGFDPGEALSHLRTRIFIVFEENPTRRLAAVVLRRQGGTYSLKGRTRLDDDTQADTSFVPITDDPHVVEIRWQRATSPDASDGSFEIWIDGVSAGTMTDLDNHRSSVDYARLGALSVKAGASGTLYWDEFESRRQSYIGP